MLSNPAKKTKERRNIIEKRASEGTEGGVGGRKNRHGEGCLIQNVRGSHSTTKNKKGLTDENRTMPEGKGVIK